MVEIRYLAHTCFLMINEPPSYPPSPPRKTTELSYYALVLSNYDQLVIFVRDVIFSLLLGVYRLSDIAQLLFSKDIYSFDIEPKYPALFLKTKSYEGYHEIFKSVPS